MPVQNAISRRFEVQADKKAQILTGDHQGQIDLAVELAKSNLSMVQPNKIIRTILYSHPPIMERINNALAWKEE